MQPCRKQVKTPDAIVMLREDHQRLQRLFREFARTDPADAGVRLGIARRACAELKVHTTLEQEIFYPAAWSVLDEDLMHEAELEHRCAMGLIGEVERLAPGDPAFAGTFAVLAEHVRHHVRDEQAKMFPRLRQEKDRLDLVALAADMRARRDRLVASLAEPDRPRMQRKLFAVSFSQRKTA